MASRFVGAQRSLWSPAMAAVQTMFRPGEDVWFRGRPAQFLAYRGRASAMIRFRENGVESAVGAGKLGRTKKQSLELALLSLERR